MSLSFLAKKAWHTSNVKNVEKVWLAEQEHAKEEKRLAELKKQIEEERQIDELRELQRSNGLVAEPSAKVEWMYEGPGSALSEEYKLGREYKPTSAASVLEALESKEAAGSTLLSAAAGDANEQFSRLTQDPLYAMRAAHKTERDRHVLQNPLAMKRIKKSLADQLEELEDREKAKKAAKELKKAAKKAKKKKKKKKKTAADDKDEEEQEDDDGERSKWGLQKGERSTEPRELGPPKALLEAVLEREEAARARVPPKQKPKLSEADLERRREEMAADARAHQASRLTRMRDHRGSAVAECLEEDEAGKTKQKRQRRRQPEDAEDDDDEVDAPRFLRQVKSDVYGETGTIDLAESVQRTRNRHQKKRARAEDFF
ncbi:hypothetical protein CTAYLR_007747 [Chrysophaeum taylorii]|uniref:CBF1-interacting co-repressor CIR N-terminal domain-containing protein n=1 Tax=Chrysophaeum taylorii TaxID=2483200 RepID=A0AAD7UBG7_9STRA|nr:hypothetical protein CTAYLR_007747 [Chrysophaeum taylorii]